MNIVLRKMISCSVFSKMRFHPTFLAQIMREYRQSINGTPNVQHRKEKKSPRKLRNAPWAPEGSALPISKILDDQGNEVEYTKSLETE